MAALSKIFDTRSREVLQSVEIHFFSHAGDGKSESFLDAIVEGEIRNESCHAIRIIGQQINRFTRDSVRLPPPNFM